MKKQNKLVIAVLLATVVSGAFASQPILKKNKYLNSVITSIKNNDFIQASGQYGPTNPFVTVAVEQLTANHLPNITGTCSLYSDMVFTIKKGASGTISEVINQKCDISPYTLNPTITLPDGKYRVDVSVTYDGCSPNCF
jgi:hypothetical protein